MKKRKLLLVDDEPDILKILKSRLNLEGFDCLSADNAKDALEIAKKEKPELIILDLVLPDKDGLEIYRELKACEDTEHIPVIVYTAQNPEMVADKGLEALEVVDFVFKPFDGKSLVYLIEESLRRIDKKKTPKK